jgi:hypothetical protein
MSVKLPYTSYEALKLSFARPTGYGLGKKGWVTIEPAAEQMPSLEVLKSWIDESYRAQAPKKLAASHVGVLRSLGAKKIVAGRSKRGQGKA